MLHLGLLIISVLGSLSAIFWIGQFWAVAENYTRHRHPTSSLTSWEDSLFTVHLHIILSPSHLPHQQSPVDFLGSRLASPTRPRAIQVQLCFVLTKPVLCTVPSPLDYACSLRLLKHVRCCFIVHSVLHLHLKKVVEE